MKRLLSIPSLLIFALILAAILLIGIIFIKRTENRTDSTHVTLSTQEGVSRSTFRTSTWFSSANQFPTGWIYNLPGGFKIDPEGLSLGLLSVPNTQTGLIMGAVQPWCTLQWSGGVQTAHVHEYSDFSAQIAIASQQDQTAKLHLIQGSPLAWIENAPQELPLRCTGTTITKTDNGLLLTQGERGESLLIQAKDGSFDGTGDMAVLRSPQGMYRVIALPNKEPAVVQKLSTSPWSTSSKSSVTWEKANEAILTTYQLDEAAPHFMTIWPHQWPHLTENPAVLGEYQTTSGPLRLVEGRHFQTKLPIAELPFGFAKKSASATELNESIKQETKDWLIQPPPGGVYFRGTWIGGLTTLLQLAQTQDLTEEQTQLQARLNQILEESSLQFTYDDNLKLIRALNPEFGNEKGNDHHFHYGYYLRALAVLKSLQPLSPAQQKMGEQLTADIATIDRTSTTFPFLRTFDLYAGHSWADGQGMFADGNNQESTSEALNAWYAVALWARSQENNELEAAANWMYAQELQATATYWFGTNNPFPPGYDRPMASLVWNGKREFTTWFSPQAGHIVGIQLLPITPSSSNLTNVIDMKKLLQETRRVEPKLAEHEWYDLFVIAESWVDPSAAQAKLPSVNTFAGARLRSLLLYFVSN